MGREGTHDGREIGFRHRLGREALQRVEVEELEKRVELPGKGLDRLLADEAAENGNHRVELAGGARGEEADNLLVDGVVGELHALGSRGVERLGEGDDLVGVSLVAGLRKAAGLRAERRHNRPGKSGPPPPRKLSLTESTCDDYVLILIARLLAELVKSLECEVQERAALELGEVRKEELARGSDGLLWDELHRREID